MKDVKPNTKALTKESSSDEEDSDDEDEGEEEEASKTPKKNVTLSSSFYILLNSVEKKALMIMHHLAFAFSGLSSIIPLQTCTAFYFTITVVIWFKKCISCSQPFFLII